MRQPAPFAERTDRTAKRGAKVFLVTFAALGKSKANNL